MAWKDKHMDWKQAEVHLGLQDLLPGLITPAVDEGGTATFAAGALLVDVLEGNKVLVKEVQKQMATASDGATDADGDTFTSASSTFVTDGVVAGDRIKIGSEAEVYIAEVTNETTLELATAVTGNLSSQTFYVKRRPGLIGLSFEAAGAHLFFPWRVPAQVDIREALGFTVHWVSDSVTAADDIHWVLKVQAVAAGEAFLHESLVALDTAIAAETIGSTTPLLVHASERGILNAGAIAAGDILYCDLELDVCDADVGSSENVWLLGLTVDYWPNQMRD